MNKFVDKAVEIVGTKKRLAEELGINPAAFHSWHPTRVPAERVLGIERATNGQISRHEMRSDIYPIEPAA